MRENLTFTYVNTAWLSLSLSLLKAIAVVAFHHLEVSLHTLYRVPGAFDSSTLFTCCTCQNIKHKMHDEMQTNMIDCKAEAIRPTVLPRYVFLY